MIIVVSLLGRFYGLDQCSPVASNGRYRARRLAGCVAKKVQTKLGILGVPGEQYSLDNMGFARSRLRPDCASVLPRGLEHQGSHENPDRMNETTKLWEPGRQSLRYA